MDIGRILMLLKAIRALTRVAVNEICDGNCTDLERTLDMIEAYLQDIRSTLAARKRKE